MFVFFFLNKVLAFLINQVSQSCCMAIAQIQLTEIWSSLCNVFCIFSFNTV